MDVRLRNLLLSLCTCAVLIQHCGCRKADDHTPPSAANKPATTSGTSGAASANSIDSIVGTYYGRGIRWGSDYVNGTRHDFGYDGPDTLIVTRSGADGISVQSNLIARSDYFVFDSSATMHSYGSRNFTTTEASLDFYPANDSVKYGYRYQSSEEGTFCSFVGRK